MDIESDSDEETQIHDIEQLTAALEADEPDINDISSQCSSATNENSISSNTQQEYSKIEAALALNKLTDEKLRRLESILTGRLHECRQKLSEIQGYNPLSDKQDKQVFRYVNCGRPYFRDQSNFPAPDNDDTILMQNSGMYDFSQVSSVPGWTVKDKSEFMSSLLVMSQNIMKQKLNSKIAQLKRESKGKNSKQYEKEIVTIKKEIYDLPRKRTLNTIALPLDEEYDWEMIAAKLNRRHKAQEYQALWKLFLHPSINKSTWSRTEHVALQNIAHSNHLQDWDKIAKELNTRRTGYQCFVYFRTNMSNTLTGQKWTKEEEEFLKRLIDYYREDDYIPWGKVAASMENRTKIQVYNKYSRLLEQRKGRFLPEEDAVILTYSDNFGPNFKKMTKYLPGRSSTQLRVRYHVLSKRTRISAVWTVEEDKKLIQIMANQDATNFSCLTKHFPGKDRVHIRARYNTLIKWMRKHPSQDIAKAPRRGARRLCHGQPSADLTKAVENLKNRMQSEVENKKPKRVSPTSPDDVIEDAIVATLITENIREEEATRNLNFDAELNEHNVHCTNTVNMLNLKKMLLLLKAKLDKMKFMDSSNYEKYQNLVKTDQESCSVKVKSYSRKEKIKTISLKGAPDIWGNNVLSNTEYMLPPNYATITGCRKLMAYVSGALQTAGQTPANFSLLARKNVFFKEQLFSLIERFNFLFLWPILLSNQSPPERLQESVRRIGSLQKSLEGVESIDDSDLEV